MVARVTCIINKSYDFNRQMIMNVSKQKHVATKLSMHGSRMWKTLCLCHNGLYLSVLVADGITGIKIEFLCYAHCCCRAVMAFFS